jgi:hypothetical protein
MVQERRHLSKAFKSEILFEIKKIKDGCYHRQRNFKDTNPLMLSLLVIFVWGGEAIL